MMPKTVTLSWLRAASVCLKSEEDYDSYFEDTMRAGHYENRRESVDMMIRSSQHIIRKLIDYGVDFEKDGRLSNLPERGAHSDKRILFH